MGMHIPNCTKYNQITFQNAEIIYIPTNKGIQSAEGERMLQVYTSFLWLCHGCDKYISLVRSSHFVPFNCKESGKCSPGLGSCFPTTNQLSQVRMDFDGKMDL